MELAHQINSAQYLYLCSISEPEDNVLNLIIEEAGVSSDPKDIQIGGRTISGMRDIVSDKNSRAYELVFANYISYSVTNEEYSILDAAEVRTGRLFCVYSKSHFLDHVRASTLASEDYPGPFTHYGINCLNHTIDVVSAEEPAIKIVKGILK